MNWATASKECIHHALTEPPAGMWLGARFIPDGDLPFARILGPSDQKWSVFSPTVGAATALNGILRRVLTSAGVQGSSSDPTRITAALQLAVFALKVQLEMALQRIGCLTILPFLFREIVTRHHIAESLAGNPDKTVQGAVADLVSVEAQVALELLVEEVAVRRSERSNYTSNELLIDRLSAAVLAAEGIVRTRQYINDAAWSMRGKYTLHAGERNGWFILEMQLPEALEARRREVLSRIREQSRLGGPQDAIVKAEKGRWILRQCADVSQRELGVSLEQVLEIGAGLASLTPMSPDKRPGLLCVARWQRLRARIQAHLGVSDAQATAGVKLLVMRAQSREVGLDGFDQNIPDIGIRRGPLISMGSALGGRLVWCPQLVAKSVDRLFQDLVFRALPDGWVTRPDSELHRALAVACQQVDREWEGEVSSHLEREGLPGISSVKSIRTASGRNVRLPALVGDIDGLHWNSDTSTILVIEAKRSRPRWEPKGAGSELSQFLAEPKGYVAKLRRKTEWVARNRQDVLAHLQYSGKAHGAAVVDPSVVGIVITQFETMTQVHCSEVRITSLATLISERRCLGEWKFRS